MLTRRDFLARLQAAGLTFPLAGQLNLLDNPDVSKSQVFQNDYFSVSFDTKTGRTDINRRNGEKLLSGSVVRALTGQGYVSSGHSSSKHSVRSGIISDQLGEGQQVTINTSNPDNSIDFNLTISLYKNHHAVFIEAICYNRSSKPTVLQSIEPVCACNETGGALYWPLTTKLLTNGPMYYNPGEVADFSIADENARQSWWNIGLFSGYDHEGLAAGAVENLTAQGMIIAKRGKGDTIGLIAKSALAEGFILGSGKKIRSNRFVLYIASDPYSALEGYAAIMGKVNKARVNSVVNGWCNWFYTYEHITEDEVVSNAEFASRILKPYGMEYMQIDEGYQQWHGEWDGNNRFPHGMKWLADRIHSYGLKPGLWIAPYVISEPTEIFQKHKEWLIKNPDGSLKRVGPWPDVNTDWAKNENPKRYGLDITHTDAADWMYKLFEKVSKQWGYEMIKIDFVDWSLLSAHHYYDPSVSLAMAYRRGFEIIRKAIGNECHLQDCGPGPVSVGLADSMRIELDQNYGFTPEVWKQYFNSTGSAPAAAKRYYFHKRTWINDADHLCISLLSPSQAQAAATLLSLTGGNIISGDRLPDLDKVKIEILKKALPSWGEAARPVDLFDTDFHRIFVLKVNRSFGEWTIAGFFNSDKSEIKEYSIPLNRLWLDNAKTYIAYDFWNNRYAGEINKEIRVSVLPDSVLLLSIHEKSNIPKIISTDRHILQGAVELENVRWDADNGILSGISLGTAYSAYNICIYVPDSHSWQQGGTSLYHDFAGYTLKMTDFNILRMHVRFGEESRIPWSINFPEFFKMDKKN
jgi:Glycosyl hydrolases family 31